MEEVGKDVGSGLSIMPLRVEIKAIDEINLPPFAGSMLRGALGVALKRICCIAKWMKCEQCPIKDSCVYVYIFETPLTASDDTTGGFRNAPHPFVLRLEIYDRALTLKPGDMWSFGITLFGRAIQSFPYIVSAVNRMGEIGIGRGRGRFELVDVEFVDPLLKKSERLYHSGNLQMPESIPSIFSVNTDDGFSSRVFRINFITPLRIKQGGKLIDVPEFKIIFLSLLRRIEVLSRVHSTLFSPLVSDHLMHKASEVKLIENNTQWHDWERYSHRQRQKMKLGGIIGTAVYEGNSRYFEPYLTIGSFVHIGKNTAFGLGRYEWNIVE